MSLYYWTPEHCAKVRMNRQKAGAESTSTRAMQTWFLMHTYIPAKEYNLTYEQEINFKFLHCSVFYLLFTSSLSVNYIAL